MKPILIYKGDDTIFADLRRFLTFNIETDLDLTGWKAKFTLDWITKEINDISSKSFEIILSSEETKNLRLGSQSGSIVLTDSIGHIKTINLLKQYSSTTYSILIQPYYNTASHGYVPLIQTSSKTVSGFTIEDCYAYGSNWETKGYIS